MDSVRLKYSFFETLDKLDLTSPGPFTNQLWSDENPRPGMMSKICFYCGFYVKIWCSEVYPETCILREYGVFFSM